VPAGSSETEVLKRERQVEKGTQRSRQESTIQRWRHGDCDRYKGAAILIIKTGERGTSKGGKLPRRLILREVKRGRQREGKYSTLGRGKKKSYSESEKRGKGDDREGNQSRGKSQQGRTGEDRKTLCG